MSDTDSEKDRRPARPGRSARMPAPTARSALVVAVALLGFAGTLFIWQLLLRRQSQFIDVDVALPVGFLIAALLTMYVQALVNRTCQVEDLVVERTAELQTTNEDLQQQIAVRVRAEELFRGILESAPDAVVIVDDEGKTVLANAVSEKLFGYSRDELVGKPVEMVIPQRFHESHRRRRADFQANPHIRPMSAGIELCAVRKDGSEFPAEISLGPLKTDEGLLVVCAIRDVTERKKAEASLRNNEIQLMAAQRIQNHLLPDAPPTVPGFDIAGASYPAEFAAGDHFDFLFLPDGSIGFVVGDVAGHGFAPALLMASTQAYIRSFAQMHTDVDKILAMTNAVLARETEDDRFITLLFARLDPNARSITYANAGHPTGYVLDHSGAMKAELESSAYPLAVVDEGDFPVGGPIALQPGDLVLLLTDGILEAESPDGAAFGAEQAIRVVHENRAESADEIIRRLYGAVRDFSENGSLLDDVTAVVVKVDHAP